MMLKKQSRSGRGDSVSHSETSPRQSQSPGFSRLTFHGNQVSLVLGSPDGTPSASLPGSRQHPDSWRRQGLVWVRRLSWRGGGKEGIPVGCVPALMFRRKPVLRLAQRWPVLAGMWPVDGCGPGSALAWRPLRAGRGRLGGQQAPPWRGSGVSSPSTGRGGFCCWRPSRARGVAFPRYLRGQIGSRLGSQQLSRRQFPGARA